MKKVIYDKLREGDLIAFGDLENPKEIVEFVQMITAPDDERYVLVKRFGGFELGTLYEEGYEKVYDKDEAELIKLKQ
jgi:hypothetical protein